MVQDAINSLLGNRGDTTNSTVKLMGKVMSGVLGVDIKAEDGKGKSRTDKNGRLWVMDVDSDEGSNRNLIGEEWHN